MITQEQYNNLMSEIEKTNAKVDLYIQCQNSTEKEFRELEREVYNLKQAQGTPLSRLGSNLSNINEMKNLMHDRLHGDAGVAWLR